MVRHYLCVVIFVLLCSFYGVFADRALDQGELAQLFTEITSPPRNTWISRGTIQAYHTTKKYVENVESVALESEIQQRITQYSQSDEKVEKAEYLQKMALDAIAFNTRYERINEYTMSAREAVTYDGQRFYWSIETLSRQDSIEADTVLAGNYMTDKFSMLANQRRIFAWDGSEYVRYALPINHAIVDTTSRTNPRVNGILTAGLIPWGYGVYSYEHLSQMESRAVEKTTPDGTVIELALTVTPDIQMVITMDPDRDYAVLSSSTLYTSGTMRLNTFTDYNLVDGNWIPYGILVEKYSPSGNLLLEETWTVTQVSTQPPAIDEFTVDYQEKAKVEYRTDKSENMQLYLNYPSIDGKALLARRLTLLDISPENRNCATAAMQYLADKLGQTITYQELMPLIDPQTNKTSLYEMKNFLESKGLYCKAVQADLTALQENGYENIILHFPGKDHFVIAAEITSNDVKIIDLNRKKFLYAIDRSYIHMDWPDGIALIVSHEPIFIGESVTELTNQQTQALAGGEGYSCDNLIQDDSEIYCSDPVGGQCEGFAYEYFRRYGCKSAPSGSCNDSVFLRFSKSPCIIDPNDQLNCVNTGAWTNYYMFACE